MTPIYPRRAFLKGFAAAGAGLAATALLPRSARAAEAGDDWGSPFPAPVFPFGAVYFRKSSPPAADWERDHRVAASMGVNIFRHWFLWASIEDEPDQYDWRDYDRMVQLEGQNKIKTIIADILAAPEWMWEKYPHARIVNREGAIGHPGSSTGSATGGCPLCLDNADVLARAEKFMVAMIERYRDKPSVLGYDVWNEGNVQECYCEASQGRFRQWLKAKYGTMEALGQAWHRYSMGDWDLVQPPRDETGYPDALDWDQFKRDNALRLLRWRTELIHRHDHRNRITAHGVGALTEIEWKTAEQVDSYGYTWVASRHGNAPWMQFQAIDVVRGACRGKPFWHAEATGGPLWLQPQVLNRPLEDGRSSDEKDVRVWSLIDMAAGATGILFTRWRPLLDGPLFGAFGPMGMDGSVTPRAEMAGQLARWANAHPDLWRSRPVQGDVGILFLQESDDFGGIQGLGTGGGRGGEGGGANGYQQSCQGAYQGFFDSNIQADFVALEDIGRYPLIYLPYPEMLKQETADKLRAYVEAGGVLVSEGCPGYFGDGGRVGTVQPNLGLDRLFGAKESYVQFTPDLLSKLSLTVQGHKLGGQYFLQEYELAGGTEAGRYANGHLAAVENRVGQGRTLLIGTFPGGAYFKSHSASTREFYAGLLAWAGVKQRVVPDDLAIKARLHQGPGGTVLWVVNPTRELKTVKLTLPSAYTSATDLWQHSGQASVAGNVVTVSLEDRNAAVLQLA